MKGIIDGKKVKFKNGQTILSVARDNNIHIPTLCFMEGCNEIGFCRLCVVEVEGHKDLVSSCDTIMENKSTIRTKSSLNEISRKATLSLLSSRHRFDCFSCPKDQECNFYDELKRHHIDYNDFNQSEGRHKGFIDGEGISMDLSKCILCKKCVSVCTQYADAKVLKFRDDIAYDPVVSPTIGEDFTTGACTYCGMCLKVCPTGSLYTTPSTNEFDQYIKSDSIVIVQVSKDATNFINEEFKKAPKSNYKATLSILDRLGVDYYIDNDFGYDILIKAQADELLRAVSEDKTLFTSDSPAWIRYVEMHAPELLSNLSEFKSHHLIGANMIKDIYAKKLGVEKSKMKVVSLLPCTAAKYEIEREELNGEVDLVITASELGKYAKKKNIEFKAKQLKRIKALKENASETQTNLLYGVMNVLGLSPVFKQVKHYDLLETASVKLYGEKINVMKVVGTNAVKQMLKYLESTKTKYHYVYVKGCFGDCLNGGGQPQTKKDFRKVINDRNEQIEKVIFKDISNNDDVNDLYEQVKDKEYLKTTYSQKSFIRE